MTAALCRPCFVVCRNSSRARATSSVNRAAAARSNGASPSGIEPGDPLGRHTGMVEGEAGEVARRAPGPAVAPPAVTAGEGVLRYHGQPATVDAADQVDILYQRQRAKAADRVVESTGDE